MAAHGHADGPPRGAEGQRRRGVGVVPEERVRGAEGGAGDGGRQGVDGGEGAQGRGDTQRQRGGAQVRQWGWRGREQGDVFFDDAAAAGGQGSLPHLRHYVSPVRVQRPVHVGPSR